MEYRGGTYISQVDEQTVAQALRTWAFGLDLEPIGEFDQAAKDELIEEIDSHLSAAIGPTPLDRLINVWCASAIVSDDLMLINLVLTKQ